MKPRDALQFQRVGLQVVHCNKEKWLHLVRWSRRDGQSVAAELTFERLVDDNFMVIIPLPFDWRLGAAFRLAAQGDIVALAHYDITGGQRIVNVRWHCKREREEREKERNEGSRVLLFMPAKHKLKASSSSSRAWFKCKNFCILATSWAPWKWNQLQRRHCESHTPYQKIIYNMIRSEKCKEIFPSSSVWLPSQSWSKLSLGFWKGQTRWQSCVTHD